MLYIMHTFDLYARSAQCLELKRWQYNDYYPMIIIKYYIKVHWVSLAIITIIPSVTCQKKFMNRATFPSLWWWQSSRPPPSSLISFLTRCVGVSHLLMNFFGILVIENVYNKKDYYEALQTVMTGHHTRYGHLSFEAASVAIKIDRIQRGGGGAQQARTPSRFWSTWGFFFIQFCIRMLQNKPQIARESI